MKMGEREGEEAVDLQMTPFIDCVFLLLIFFLVAAVLKKVHHELDLDLPDAGAAVAAKSPDDMLIFSVTRDGKILVGEEVMTKSLLHKRLRAAGTANPEQKIRIDADRDTAFRHIVYLMDLCQFEGLKNVGVRTRGPS